MRVLVLLGTRPEIIRLSAVLKTLRLTEDLVVCHTGQNADHSLNEIFFEEMALPRPNYNLAAAGAGFGDFLGRMYPALEQVLDKCLPDVVLVLGDTNSALGALLAVRRQIPVYHLEAGNRSFDRRVPEEMNRRVLDHLCDFNLAYSEHARRNLLREGIEPRTVTVIGSPLREVFTCYADLLDDDSACRAANVRAGEFVLVSLHRQENVDDSRHLQGLIDGCRSLANELGCRVLVTAHPRFRKRVEHSGVPKGWILCDPFGYFRYLSLQRQARLVISDSGSVGEEAGILGFPAISPRWSMERPEALETGSVVLATTDSAQLCAVGLATAHEWADGVRPACPADYLIPDTSHRVLSFIRSTSRVAPFWMGRTGPE
ncbi:MAG: non-hydrolyzing UDP-N-acetylglucosamine 2-epimerase [Mycobacteriales bacterium]